MLKSRSWWIGCAVGAVLWLIVFSAISHASTPKPHKLAPSSVCDRKHRMDIFIDEDNIMWACECEALITIHVCKWQVIGGVDSPTIRKRHRLRARAYTIPVLVVRMPHA